MGKEEWKYSFNGKKELCKICSYLRRFDWIRFLMDDGGCKIIMVFMFYWIYWKEWCKVVF